MKQVSDARGTSSNEEKERPSVEGRKVAMVRAAVVLRHPHLVEMRASAVDAEARPRLSDAGTRLGIGAKTHDAFEPDLDGGVRLSELCKSRFASGPMPLSFGLRILLDALSGVAALHAGVRGFAHGELAPCNIVVARDGTGRLIPVVASHWKEQAPPSSDASGYVAPERLRGDPFDHRADVFSAGVMLWEMITGHSFRGLPPETITAWIVDGKIPDPVHPDDAPWVVMLGRVAMRALQVNPSDRWPHVGVIGAEIENVAEGHIASSKEVTELLADAAEGRAPVSKSDSPFTPSLSPTAVSIPPVPIPPPPPTPTFQVARAAPAVVIAPPMNERPVSSVARPATSRRRQSLIAWSTLLLALGLLGVAAHELFENSGMLSREAPTAAPQRVAAPSPVAPSPVPPLPPVAPSPAAAAAPSPVAPSPVALSPAMPAASNQAPSRVVAPAAEPPASPDQPAALGSPAASDTSAKGQAAANAPAASPGPAPLPQPAPLAKPAPAAKPVPAARPAPATPAPKNPKYRDEAFGI